MTILAVTITGRDKPGIISALTGAIFESGGNLEDASMTILEGEFAMILLACLKDVSSCVRLCKKLNVLERTMGLTISTRELKRRLIRGHKGAAGTKPWIISVSGKDRAGIVYRVSKLLARNRINITDLNSRIIGSGKGAGYALILEADLPQNERLQKRLLGSFKALERTIKMTIILTPLETTDL